MRKFADLTGGFRSLVINKNTAYTAVFTFVVEVEGFEPLTS